MILTWDDNAGEMRLANEEFMITIYFETKEDMEEFEKFLEEKWNKREKK